MIKVDYGSCALHPDMAVSDWDSTDFDRLYRSLKIRYLHTIIIAEAKIVFFPDTYLTNFCQSSRRRLRMSVRFWRLIPR